MHFENALDFLDLFLPINVSSASRARAFLWLCYHYLESAADNASRNPFSDPQASHPNKIPPLVTLTQEEMELENVDSPEEVAWGEKMMTQRKDFQARMDKGKDKKPGEGEDEPPEGTEESEPKEKGKGRAKAPVKDPVAAKLTAKEKKAAADKARRQRQKEAKKEKEAALALEAERGDRQRKDMNPSYYFLPSNMKLYP
jgi:Ino eighty subunit 1